MELTNGERRVLVKVFRAGTGGERYVRAPVNELVTAGLANPRSAALLLRFHSERVRRSRGRMFETPRQPASDSGLSPPRVGVGALHCPLRQ